MRRDELLVRLQKWDNEAFAVMERAVIRTLWDNEGGHVKVMTVNGGAVASCSGCECFVHVTQGAAS